MQALLLTALVLGAGPTEDEAPPPGYARDVAGEGEPTFTLALPKDRAGPEAGPERCRDLCYRELSCHAFVYRPRTKRAAARCELFAVPPKSVPAPGAAAGALRAYPLKTTSKRLAFEPGRARRGDPIPGAAPPSPDAEGCLDACARTPRCAAFSFHPPAPLPEGDVGPPAPLCVRLAEVQAREADPEATSGASQELRLRVTIEGAVRRPGPAYRTFDVPRRLPDDCRIACVRDARCVAFQYVAPTAPGEPGRCELRATLPDDRDKALGHLFGVIGEAGGAGAGE